MKNRYRSKLSLFEEKHRLQQGSRSKSLVYNSKYDFKPETLGLVLLLLQSSMKGLLPQKWTQWTSRINFNFSMTTMYCLGKNI